MSLNIKYENSKRFSIESRTHKITVDQKIEDGGTDRGMSPVELFAASMASCIGISLVSFFEIHKISMEKTEIKADYKISDNPHRIGSIDIDINIPGENEIDKNLKKAIKRVADECTIHNTLKNPPVINVKINSSLIEDTSSEKKEIKDITKTICGKCTFYTEGEDEQLCCGAYNILENLIQENRLGLEDILDARD